MMKVEVSTRMGVTVIKAAGVGAWVERSRCWRSWLRDEVSKQRESASGGCGSRSFEKLWLLLQRCFGFMCLVLRSELDSKDDGFQPWVGGQELDKCRGALNSCIVL